MSVSYQEDDATGIAEITVNGHVTAQDYAEAVMPLQAFIDRHGTIQLIEVIESFKGFDPSILWEGLKFDMRNIPHISHVAVVSDLGWIGPMSKAAGALISTRVRTFDLDEIAAARAWIRSA